MPAAAPDAALAAEYQAIRVARRKRERRRIERALLIASLIGACISMLTLFLIASTGPRLNHWFSIHYGKALGGAGAVRGVTVLPIWAAMLLALIPVCIFILIGAGLSVLIYRFLRGEALPADSQNTRCGWCQHELRGITKPICPECGHRVGDRGPDEKGELPLSRRRTRRVAGVMLLPLVFLIVVVFGGLISQIGQEHLFHTHANSGLNFVLSFISMFVASAVTAACYEAFVQLDLTHSGRAWCRVCNRELRDLTEPVCPGCATAI